MKKYIILIMLIAIIFIMGCTQKDNGFLVSGKKLVKINNDYITDNMINMFASGGQLSEVQKKAIMDELIDNFLIYNEAVNSDVMKDTAFVNQLELQKRLAIAGKYIEKKLKNLPMPTEEESQTYYQNNKKNFDKQVKIAIIFLGPQYNKSVADSIYDLIKRHKKSFSALAKEFSSSQFNAEKGGVLDKYFSYKDFVFAGYPVLDSVAFSLEKKGEFSMPVQTTNGNFIIVKLIDQIPSNKKYEDLRQLIMTIVYQNKRTSFLKSYSEKLRQDANIEYFDQK